MPTIKFSYGDFSNLVGKKIPIEELGSLLSYGKGELESYDEETDEITVSFGDTNLPYLWSVEGAARLVKGLIGKQKGIPNIDITRKTENILIVEPSVRKVRPFIAAFVAKGKKVDDYFIKQMIDLQEKFCESYGRRRQKAAIGIYNFKKIKFPLFYKATDPESIKFIPLEFKRKMTQKEILEEHPTGKEYANILEGKKKYPILIDSNNEVLSFPPIINSNWSGKIEIGDEDLFFEATGEDLDTVLLAANIFAQVFYERGYELYSVDLEYDGGEKITTPYLFKESVKISKSQVKELTGLDLSEDEIKKLLEKMQYNYSNGKVEIPDYRKDILHPVDVIEDIAIAYGYPNIEMQHMESYTLGETFPIVRFIDKIREIVIGFGYQETFSAILSNKEILNDKMNVKDFGTVLIKEFMSERFSAVRSWLLPVLVEVLSKNKHIDYPQKIFEQGPVCVNEDGKVKQYERLALVSANPESNYTEARQILDNILNSFGFKYEIVETEHDSFIPGRVGRVIVNGKMVAYVGEISPKVLSNFELNVPAAGFEINLSVLFETQINK